METPNNETNEEALAFTNRIDLSQLQESVFNIKKQLQNLYYYLSFSGSSSNKKAPTTWFEEHWRFF